MKFALMIVVYSMFFALQGVSSRKCYSCESEASLAGCEAAQVEYTCTNSTEECYQYRLTKVVDSVEKTFYVKGCASFEQCELYAGDKAEEVCGKNHVVPPETLISCKAKCCIGDVCNMQDILLEKSAASMAFGCVLFLVSSVHVVLLLNVS